MSRPAQILLAILASLTIPATYALAIGFELGQTKEELELKYDVSVYDHDSGSVTINFTLIDTGRLTPITSVDLCIPNKEKEEGGSYHYDLVMSMALRDEDNKQVGRVHLRKDWAERAEIQIKTGQLDGKPEPLTWYYHTIPLKELVSRAKPFQTIK